MKMVTRLEYMMLEILLLEIYFSKIIAGWFNGRSGIDRN
jgi:hypothetical protein